MSKYVTDMNLNYIINKITTQLNKISSNFTSYKSHIGMVIHTTSLDTEEKVIAIYGGNSWTRVEGRFLLAADDSHPINSEDGNESISYTPSGSVANHTLTTSQIPSHTHTYNKPNSNTNSHTLTVNEIPSHSHTYNYPGLSTNFAYGNEPNQYGSIVASNENYRTTAIGGGTGHTHGIGTTSTNTGNNTGGDGAHNHGFTGNTATLDIMPPYKTVYIWERIA